MKHTGSFLLCACLFFFSASQSLAQIQLSVSPSSAQISTTPGNEIHIPFIVHNLGDPTFIKLKIQEFIPDREDGNIKFVSTNSSPVKFSVDQTAKDGESNQLLQRSEEKKINLLATIDQSANTGDYYFMLITMSTSTTHVSGQAQLGVEAAIGAPIFISIENEATKKQNINITNVSIVNGFKFPFSNTRILDSFDHPVLKVVVKNSDKHFASINGSITQRTLLGNNSSFFIPRQSVLAKSSKILSSKNEICDKYQSHKLCSIHKTALLETAGIGRGIVTTTVSMPGKKVTRSVSYLALPFKMMIVILFSFLLAFYYIKRLRS